MKDFKKIVRFVLLGLIIWNALDYIALAFFKAETNPFIWSQEERAGMLFVISLYVYLSPLMVAELKDEM